MAMPLMTPTDIVAELDALPPMNIDMNSLDMAQWRSQWEAARQHARDEIVELRDQRSRILNSIARTGNKLRAEALEEAARVVESVTKPERLFSSRELELIAATIRALKDAP